MHIILYNLLSRLNIEIFKDVPGYEGYYKVNNLGRVKSLRRKLLEVIYGKK